MSSLGTRQGAQLKAVSGVCQGRGFAYVSGYGIMRMVILIVCHWVPVVVFLVYDVSLSHAQGERQTRVSVSPL